MKRSVIATTAALAALLASSVIAPATAQASRLPGTKCKVFPTSNYWHADISGLPVNSQSETWMANSDAHVDLHPDFGPSFGEQSVPYGIPITVTKKKPRASVSFDYDDESDHAKYPLSGQTKIEGGADAGGDRHAIVVYTKTCTLYETYDTHRLRGNKWHAGSGAIWKLKKNNLRPAGWTSADAAGLPILPGLLRWDEVKRGVVDHAIRFTLPTTQDAFIWPARHKAGSGGSQYPPMGARFRLNAGFDESRYSGQARVVLKAMKKYGMVLADNGSPWFFQGDASSGWPEDLISELKTIPASGFEAVDTTPLKISNNSAKARH